MMGIYPLTHLRGILLDQSLQRRRSLALQQLLRSLLSTFAFEDILDEVFSGLRNGKRGALESTCRELTL